MTSDASAAGRKGFAVPVSLGLLFLVVLLARAPFLDAGYGLHVDSWRIANTARHIAETGDYEVSRFPGYPVQEIACSLIWKGGPVALNGASALFSAVAVLLFALIARDLGCRDWIPASLALAFAPVFYVNSVTSKDYIWALAFILASLYAVLRGRMVIAGICLGLAIGSRLTSGVVALPFALVICDMERGKRPVRNIAILAIASFVAAVITFLPVILKYHLGFFQFYDQAYPEWSAIITRSTVEVWGSLGMVGMLIALAGIALRKGQAVPTSAALAPGAAGSFHTLAWLLAIAIYIAIFLRLPHHAAYLIPVMPFVLLLLAKYASRPAFLLFCGFVVISSFVAVDPHGISAGAIFKDWQDRVSTTNNIKGFLSFTKRIPGKNVFVVGGWEPEITNIFPESEHPGVRYVYLLKEEDVRKCIDAGETIYYASPIIRQFNYRVHGVDLAKYGARDARSLYESSAGH